MSSNNSNNNIKKEDVSIAYVAIVNDKDAPVLMKNYNYQQNEELNFQMNIFATLDLIENRVTKKMLVQENKTPVTSFLNCVNSVYLAEDEFDIYGYVTVGRLKILAILHQKTMANYDERHIQTFMSKVYAAYVKDIMNPFITSIDDHKLTKKFHVNLDSIVAEYQAILKKSV